MKAVLRELAQARRHYSKLPFFGFLRCESVVPHDRLAFLPCAAPLIMALPDFERLVLRDAESRHPWQRFLDAHLDRGGDSWRAFLDDFAKLGFDRSASVTQVMRGWLRDDARASRFMGTRLAQIAHGATPLEKLVIAESLDGTARVFFEHCAPLAARIHDGGGPQLRWIGQAHFAQDSSRALQGLDRRALESIELTPPERVRCLGLAFQVFDLFADWSTELLAYAEHALEQRPRVVIARGLTA